MSDDGRASVRQNSTVAHRNGTQPMTNTTVSSGVMPRGSNVVITSEAIAAGTDVEAANGIALASARAFKAGLAAMVASLISSTAMMTSRDDAERVGLDAS